MKQVRIKGCHPNLWLKKLVLQEVYLWSGEISDRWQPGVR
jgi:hypothetical protein